MSVEDEWACASLCYRYAAYADRARHKVATLFAEDGTLELHRGKLHGRPAIAEDFKERPCVVTLHYCTNVVIDLLGLDRAEGTAHLLSIGHRSDGEPLLLPLAMPMARTAGIYHDTYVRHRGKWLFQSRRLEVVFNGAR